MTDDLLKRPDTLPVMKECIGGNHWACDRCGTYQWANKGDEPAPCRRCSKTDRLIKWHKEWPR
jgi:hypothetical protein